MQKLIVKYLIKEGIFLEINCRKGTDKFVDIGKKATVIEENLVHLDKKVYKSVKGVMNVTEKPQICIIANSARNIFVIIVQLKMHMMGKHTETKLT